MFGLIITIIFVISLGGVVFFVVRKLPILAIYSPGRVDKGDKHGVIAFIENKIEAVSTFFKKMIFLHRILLWIKIMVVKIETKLDYLLHKVRRRAQRADKE